MGLTLVVVSMPLNIEQRTPIQRFRGLGVRGGKPLERRLLGDQIQGIGVNG
jgi:hypothetical protein